MPQQWPSAHMCSSYGPASALGPATSLSCSRNAAWPATLGQHHKTAHGQPRKRPAPRPGRNLGLGRQRSFPPGPLLARRSAGHPGRPRRSNGSTLISESQNQVPADGHPNPRTFLILPSLSTLQESSSSRHPWRPVEEEHGAAVGPLAGARARLWLSTPPSSGLAVVPPARARARRRPTGERRLLCSFAHGILDVAGGDESGADSRSVPFPSF
jgi:hypothetical protein